MKVIKKHYEWLIILPLFILLFSSGLFSGPLWDDYAFIFESDKLVHAPHPFVYWQSDSGHTRSWPLGYSILWILYNIFFEHYIFYKILNLALHFLNYILLRKIGKYSSIPTCFHVAALLFLIHPLHVETLSWIFQINTILSMTFTLLSLLACLRANISKRKHPYLILALLLFFLGLLVKSYYVAFAGLFFFLIKHTLTVRIIYTLLFLCCSFYMTDQTIQGVGYSSSEKKHREQFGNTYTSNTPVEQERPSKRENALRLSLISHNFSSYLFHFLFPYKLQFIYRYENLTGYFSYFYNTVFFLFLFVLILSLWRQKTLCPLPVTMALATLFLSFIPVSGLFYIPLMKYSPISNHWAYSLLPPLSFLLVYGIVRRPFILVCISIYLVVGTLHYGRVFNNHKKMLEKNIRYHPNSAFLHAYLAHHYELSGNLFMAYICMKQAVEKNPHNHTYIAKLNEYRNALVR